MENFRGGDMYGRLVEAGETGQALVERQRKAPLLAKNARNGAPGSGSQNPHPLAKEREKGGAPLAFSTPDDCWLIEGVFDNWKFQCRLFVILRRVFAVEKFGGGDMYGRLG